MKKLLAALALGILAATPALAIEAMRLAPGEAVVVDGRLDDAPWARAQRLDRFWEVFPQAETEARMRTEARYAYDDHSLYVAVRAWDPDVEQLRAPFARRDKVLADQDMIVLFIDPVGNRKFAHFFRVNPRGAVGDGLYNEDSGAEDFSPDFDFEVVTGRFEGGWTAEFRIPFSSLRYGDPAAKTWSTMVWRNWPRDDRYRFSTSKLPRDANCFLCLNEPLVGLDQLPSARFLAVRPELTVRNVTRREGSQPSRAETDVVASVDVKWRPRADVVVDATINPDFSQVEVDAPQLSGNSQFALFFPEKRPFFLEGNDILESPFRALPSRDRSPSACTSTRRRTRPPPGPAPVAASRTRAKTSRCWKFPSRRHFRWSRTAGSPTARRSCCCSGRRSAGRSGPADRPGATSDCAHSFSRKGGFSPSGVTTVPAEIAAPPT